MTKDLDALAIPAFDLESFMKSITYAPEGMTVNLARRLVEQEEDLPAPKREARILQRALEILPIGIHDSDLIAGNYGPAFADPAFLEEIRQADQAEFGGSEEFKVRSEEERQVSGRYMLFGIYTPSHTCIDYGSLINKGLRHYEARVRERLAQPVDGYGKIYLEAMIENIGIVQAFAGRYLALAKEKLAACREDRRRMELERMIRTLERVPYEPATDLFEALQSMWILHTAIPASERSWASISLGRMDKYLLPFYREWLVKGNTREEAKQLLAAFFRLLDSYGDGSCALNLGPEWNELSMLLLEVEKQVKLRSPIIAARIGEETPEEVYDALVDKGLFEIGQPTFYGERPCVRAMEYRGMTEADGHAINSCMGMVVVGKELADMWGCCVNMNLPLELAINNGKPLLGSFPPSLQEYIDAIPPVRPDSMEQIKRAYAAYMRGIAAYVADRNRYRAAWVALNRPNPLLSLITEDCISFARDRAHSALYAMGEAAEDLLAGGDLEEIRKGRGAKYHNVTVLAMGFAHAADSLSAIQELVFNRKQYTLEQLMQAARDDYQGESAMQIYAQLRRCPKYADGSDRADENAAFVLEALADACESLYTGNMRYLPTCHTIDANVQFGNCVYASLDARRDGEPFGKNAGPVMTALKNTPTDLMVSAAKLPQYRYSGGVPIDIYLPENIMGSQENRDKFKDLLKAYIQMGGMQVQVNSVNLELLKKAYAEPDQYPHVIVRKGGFSLYFTDMFREVQKDMIQRFEREAGRA